MLCAVRRVYFSRCRAIWRWNHPKQHANLKMLECENSKKNSRRSLHAGTAHWNMPCLGRIAEENLWMATCNDKKRIQNPVKLSEHQNTRTPLSPYFIVGSGGLIVGRGRQFVCLVGREGLVVFFRSNSYTNIIDWSRYFFPPENQHNGKTKNKSSRTL